ncbi:hypothetical protein BGZ60DRAFT_532293 [Tricladium varicosporioides]|nr:hypothetical protein BGZ60DRAFT_532293 [Hymenoscyphus varicosporioides]
MKFIPATITVILLYRNLTSVSAAPVSPPPIAGDIQGLSYIIAGPGTYIPATNTTHSSSEAGSLRINQLAPGPVVTWEGARRFLQTEIETHTNAHHASRSGHIIERKSTASRNEKSILLPPNDYGSHPDSNFFKPIRNITIGLHVDNSTVAISFPSTPSASQTTAPQNDKPHLLTRNPRRHSSFLAHQNFTKGSHNSISTNGGAPVSPHNIEHGLLSTLASQAAAAAARTCLYGKTCSSVGGAVVDTILGGHHKGGKKAQNGNSSLG